MKSEDNYLVIDIPHPDSNSGHLMSMTRKEISFRRLEKLIIMKYIYLERERKIFYFFGKTLFVKMCNSQFTGY